MIGQIKTGTLAKADISAVIHQGLRVKTADGKPARLAIIDESGTIIEAGDQVAREAFNVSIASYKNFLIGNGHLRVTNHAPEEQAK
ncbi:hypothetical protein ACLIKD_06865 [Azonexus sp. IMCC34842]|uniref:hypothetical protein n=1 Tax=Azonexus sp. IMCC34842 TaxID=3420950 RepID=UPI003D09A26B